MPDDLAQLRNIARKPRFDATLRRQTHRTHRMTHYRASPTTSCGQLPYPFYILRHFDSVGLGRLFAQGSIDEITDNEAVQEIYLGKGYHAH